MNFRKQNRSAEPEIHLIPFIDVLLVVLIFLMLTSTWSRLTEINLTLPLAEAEKQKDRPRQIILTVNTQGQYAVNKTPVGDTSVSALTSALARTRDKTPLPPRNSMSQVPFLRLAEVAAVRVRMVAPRS